MISRRLRLFNPIRTLRAAALTGVALWSLAAAAAASLPAEDAAPASELQPLPEHSATTRHILKSLRERHYVYQLLDDESSSIVFNEFLSDLDPSKSYLSQEDLDVLKPLELKLDNALRRGDLTPAFTIFNRYHARVLDRLDWVIGQLEQGIEQYDFTRDEVLVLDRELEPWSKNQRALDDLWRQRIKNDVLNLKLADKAPEAIAELLLKRYRNRLNRSQQTRSDDVYQLFINALARTYDPHTQYFSPTTAENFNINMSLSLEGIGAVLSIEDEYTKIVSLVPAGPADKSKGLKPSDRITAVGQGPEGELVDVIGWRLDDVVSLIRGKKDTIVRLEVLPASAMDTFSSKVVSIVRNKVELEEQSAQAEIITIEGEPEPLRIGVIDIPTFYIDFQALQDGDPNYRSTTRDVKRLLKELEEQDVDAILVDLRDNGGGSLQEAKTLTGLFIDRGPTVQIRSKSDRVDVLTDRDYRVEYSGPLAVLVNRLSASASEIVAGAIQDYGRGLVIGTQTFGKGTVQTLQPLLRGQLKMTQAKFYRISGESTQHRGIIPDIHYPVDYDPESIGESTLERPLPWDKITPALYRAKDDLAGLIPELSALHAKRIASNPEFEYLKAAYEYQKQRRAKNTVTLNEINRKAEQVASKAFWLELTNRKRVAQGLKEVNSLEELDEDSSVAQSGSAGTTAPLDANVMSPNEALIENPSPIPTLGKNDAESVIPSSEEKQNDTASLALPSVTPPPDARVLEAGHILADFLRLKQREPLRQAAFAG